MGGNGSNNKINQLTGLTRQEEKFCEAYVKTGDAVKSVKKAYPSNKGSNNTLEGFAYTLLHKKSVQKYMRILREKDPDTQKEFFLNAQKMAQLFMKMYQDTNNVAERSIALKALENLAKSKFCDFYEKEQTNVNILNVTEARRIDEMLLPPNALSLTGREEEVIEGEVVKEEEIQE